MSNDYRIYTKTNLFNLDFTPTNLLELLKRNNNTYSTLLSNHNNSSCFIKANFRKVKLNSKNVYIVILEDLTSMKQEIINNQFTNFYYLIFNIT